MKDRIVDLQYVPVSHIYKCIYADLSSRNQLIQTFMSKKSSTAPFLNPSGSATPKLGLIPLRQSDYPKVQHWVRKRGDSSQVSVIKVVDANSTSDDDGNLGSDDLLLHETCAGHISRTTCLIVLVSFVSHSPTCTAEPGALNCHDFYIYPSLASSCLNLRQIEAN